MAKDDTPIGKHPRHGDKPPAAPRGTNPDGCNDAHGDPPRDLPPFSPNYRPSDTNARIDNLIREDKPRRRIQTLFPYLFVRAVPGDVGARPLWQPTVCWESCDILLLPAGPGAFDFARTVARPTAGQSYRIFVHVWNLGRFAAYGARLRVWWVEPGFFNGTPDPRYQPHFIGGTYFDMGDRASSESHRLIEVPTPWRVVMNADAHECLLAAVECATDPWDGVLDSNNRRHVAQRNLDLLSGSASLVPLLHLLGAAVSRKDKELLVTHASVTRSNLAGAHERGLAGSEAAPEGWNHSGLRLANDDLPLALVRQAKESVQFFNLRAATAVPRPGAKLGRGTTVKGALRSQLPSLLGKALGLDDLTAGGVAAALGGPGQARVLRFALTGSNNQTGGYSVLLTP